MRCTAGVEGGERAYDCGLEQPIALRLAMEESDERRDRAGIAERCEHVDRPDVAGDGASDEPGNGGAIADLGERAQRLFAGLGGGERIGGRAERIDHVDDPAGELRAASRGRAIGLGLGVRGCGGGAESDRAAAGQLACENGARLACGDEGLGEEERGLLHDRVARFVLRAHDGVELGALLAEERLDERPERERLDALALREHHARRGARRDCFLGSAPGLRALCATRVRRSSGASCVGSLRLGRRMRRLERSRRELLRRTAHGGVARGQEIEERDGALEGGAHSFLFGDAGVGEAGTELVDARCVLAGGGALVERACERERRCAAEEEARRGGHRRIERGDDAARGAARHAEDVEPELPAAGRAEGHRAGEVRAEAGARERRIFTPRCGEERVARRVRRRRDRGDEVAERARAGRLEELDELARQLDSECRLELVLACVLACDDGRARPSARRRRIRS